MREFNDSTWWFTVEAAVPGDSNITLPRAVVMGWYPHVGFWGTRDRPMIVFSLLNTKRKKISDCCFYSRNVVIYDTYAKIVKNINLSLSNQFVTKGYSLGSCIKKPVPNVLCSGLKDSVVVGGGNGAGDDFNGWDKWK
ncbi:MAG: hypothetical protein GXO48_03675 [Chlorobi bacterium]|nr:hypothetical protein [Chlorobiota bacterium]